MIDEACIDGAFILYESSVEKYTNTKTVKEMNFKVLWKKILSLVY